MERVPRNGLSCVINVQPHHLSRPTQHKGHLLVGESNVRAKCFTFRSGIKNETLNDPPFVYTDEDYIIF